MTNITKSTVRIAFTTERMTNSTELKRLRRSIETLYYVLLFSNDERYQLRDDVWSSWARMGFGTGLQEAPPRVERSDRLRLETFSDGKTLTFTALVPNDSVGNIWVQILRELDIARTDVASLGADDRAAALVVNGELKKRIIDPVSEATARLSSDDAQVLKDGVRTALAVLTYPLVVSCTVTEESAPS